MTIGIVFLGHGTRVKTGVQEIYRFVYETTTLIWNAVLQENGITQTKCIAQNADLEVRTAFLEFSQPDITAAIMDLLNLGITTIVLVPLFLSAAKHITEDIPRVLQPLELQFPVLKFHIMDSMGPHPAVATALFDRLHQLIDSTVMEPDGVVLAVHGHQGEVGNEPGLTLADLLRCKLPGITVQTAFLGGCGYSIESALNQLASHGKRRIVVLPCLLFQGKMLMKLSRYVRDWRAFQPTYILVTKASHLGAHPKLIQMTAQNVIKRLQAIGLKRVKLG